MEEKTGCAVGIDLGGTFIKYALVSDEGKIIFQNKVALGNDVSREVILEKIYQSVNKTLDEAARRSIEVSGIGVGSPGIVYNGVIIGGADNLNGWENIELKSFLENKFHLMTQVENDANVMGLGEVFYGAARGCSDVVFLTIGTGIGGAMVLNGKLYGGYQNRGGELGHITIAYNGIDCNCGGRGCLEAYASTSALIKQYTKAMEISDDGIDGRYIVKKYLAKEPEAVDCMRAHTEYLGHGIASLVNIFAPQKVVIGGGISESGSFYTDMIRKSVFKYAMSDCSFHTEIVRATLGNSAGCIGAACLILKSKMF